MKRESIFRVFLKGLGSALLGNILGGVLTISLAPLLSEWYIPYIAVLLTAFIYSSLIFTAGMKEGHREFRIRYVEKNTDHPKNRMLLPGFMISAAMTLVCAVLFMCTLGVFPMTGELLLGAYFLYGAFAPAFFMAGGASQLTPVLPCVFAALYTAVTLIPALIGFRVGVSDRSISDFMYEKQDPADKKQSRRL